MRHLDGGPILAYSVESPGLSMILALTADILTFVSLTPDFGKLTCQILKDALRLEPVEWRNCGRITAQPSRARPDSPVLEAVMEEQDKRPLKPAELNLLRTAKQASTTKSRKLAELTFVAPKTVDAYFQRI